jgi:hypothetical protein
VPEQTESILRIAQTFTCDNPEETLKKKFIVVLFLALGSSAWGSQVFSMFFVGGTNPGFFDFKVSGVDLLLLCDQLNPNVTTQPYNAIGYSLAELAGATTLALFGDPNALQNISRWRSLTCKHTRNPNLAPDLVRANRIIVEGSGPHTPWGRRFAEFRRHSESSQFPPIG